MVKAEREILFMSNIKGQVWMILYGVVVAAIGISSLWWGDALVAGNLGQWLSDSYLELFLMFWSRTYLYGFMPVYIVCGAALIVAGMMSPRYSVSLKDSRDGACQGIAAALCVIGSVAAYCVIMGAMIGLFTPSYMTRPLVDIVCTVGAIVGLALFAAGLVWYIRRRCKGASSPSAIVLDMTAIPLSMPLLMAGWSVLHTLLEQWKDGIWG